MQPQSDKQSASKSKLASRANPQQQPQPEQQHQRLKVKVIKSKRPLCHFKFYLDICDHQLTKRIEAEIKALGGTLEFFLNDSITHFITDKEKGSSSLVNAAANQNSRCRPGTPLTPATPNTPHTPIASSHEDGGGIQRRSLQTRADAILSRVRASHQSTPNQCPTETLSSQQKQQQQSCHSKNLTVDRLPSAAYTVWQTEYALRFFQRIQTELRQYLQGAGTGTAAGSANIQLKGNYIKIESIKRSHRPYYHLIKQPEQWPKIDLRSNDGAFRLQAKADVKSMTRKSLGSRTSQRQQDKDKDPQQPVPLQHAAVKALKKQSLALKTPESPRSHCRDPKESSDKQCGVCEICKIEYDTLTIHLQSKDHELFAKNAQNFLALDTLIQVSASLNGFLEREEQQQKREQQQQLQQQQHLNCHRKDHGRRSDQTDVETDSDMEVDELLNDSSIALATKSLNQIDADADALQRNITRQRPSPALREKSKRITKGKHSSEKFQASPNTPPNQPTTPSPNKKVSASCSLLELQRMELSASNATTAAATPTNPTKRKTQNSVLSPPIRAMLPPSSLYKVVEASDATATTPRVRRGAANAAGHAMDSPSLIVKFQKVRQSELQRLNGEAENFMFPRTTTRSSSELPTDVDRQTTSDPRGHHSISSASLDSTSEPEVAGLSITNMNTANLQKRAVAVGRRRKDAAALPTVSPQLQRQLSTGSSSSNGGGSQQKRFPNAPIQPEIQPQLLKQRQATATRKSSRMATAIVTAATTSSQLQLRRQTQSTLIGRRGGKLEDRMGESTTNTTNTTTTTKRKKMQQELEEELEELEEDDDESHDESSCSSGSDEDYVASSKLNKSMPTPSRLDTREERAARRLSRLTIGINRTAGDEQQLLLSPTSDKKPTARRRGRSQKPATPKSKQSKQQTTPAKATKAAAATLGTDLLFDCSKSERLQKLRYTFEELPSAELWYRVFQRQDAGEEHYYSYYGSTQYRKLPYELGPIPMERTKSHSCSICQQQQQAAEQVKRKTEAKPETLPVKLEQDVETEQVAAHSDSNQTAATTTTTTTSSMYKHKKLHLLQRYQQEQQEQQQPQATLAKCDSKASTPELLEREFAPLSERPHIKQRVRATSTQSSSSSSCSNSQKSSATCRNKQLARVAELPPRKSPREHASTLALVSCIIRQRQDSQSKTNSEAEEPTVTATATAAPTSTATQTPVPTPVAPIASKLKTPLKQETAHNTRSQAATPVEEMRFATEISETVKRMRRGQNKYDISPPVPVPAPAPTPVLTPTPTRCRRPTAAAAAAAAAAVASYSRRLEFAARDKLPTTVLLGKRKRRQMAVTAATRTPQQQSCLPVVAGVRKLPSKKGILEYEMEASALKALDASLQYTNPLLVAYQIDKHLELAGREYDFGADEQLPLWEPADVDLREEVPTPPPTDSYFTSEFDLCDLLPGSGAGSGEGDDDELFAARNSSGCRRNSRMNLYNSFQRKRKCLKSNRTGWPRVQRRRAAGMANAKSLREVDVRCGMQERQENVSLKHELLETEEEQTTTTTTTTADKEISREQDEDNGGDGGGGDGDGAGDSGGADDKEQTTRGDAVMTPPATDLDEQVGNDESGEDAAAAVDNESQGENEDEDDDDETMADSVDQLQDDEAEIEATDADVEEDDAEDDDVYEDAFDGEETKHEQLLQDPAQSHTDEPPEKRARLTAKRDVTSNESPIKKALLSLPRSNGYSLNATSTPSTQLARQQQNRRTPQMNGSLGSCISPSEKLGDNSDIFTVSSDGLDTDLDLSNTQAGDSLDHCPHQQQQQTTPKRKFDISKYAPPNNGKAASSCAAEAATAAVKSLAISQFLKKEVRVTCRRLRAPFRRFRYRR